MPEPDTSFDVSLDDQTVKVDPLDIDGNEWVTIKKATGLPAKQVMQGVEDLDFECLAAIVWIHIRRDDPDVDLEAVLGGLSLRGFETGDGNESDDESEDEAPSGSGASSEE